MVVFAARNILLRDSVYVQLARISGPRHGFALNLLEHVRVDGALELLDWRQKALRGESQIAGTVPAP